MSPLRSGSSSPTLHGGDSAETLHGHAHLDVEKQTKTKGPEKVPHWRLVASQTLITDAVLNHHYKGSGSEGDPYLVDFIPDDPRNPMEFPQWKKWAITLTVAVATLAVAFVSSAYTGSIVQIIEEFRCSQEVATLGVSLFVLGFAIGPLLWAPLSELYGRQWLFIGTYAILTAFNAGAAGANSITTLIVLRFFAGTFGASPLTNAGGVIADMFQANQRGLGMSIFAAAPFLGPVIGKFFLCYNAYAVESDHTSNTMHRTNRGRLHRRDCGLALGRRRYGHVHRRRLDCWRDGYTRDVCTSHTPQTCQGPLGAHRQGVHL